MNKTLREDLNYSPVELAFGTSGLRGLVSDMTDLECYINTRGFLQFLLDSKAIESGTAVALSGDFRNSTPRILLAVARGIIDNGCKVTYLGKVPIPAAAFFGLNRKIPVAMVTGSHIPDDRNGIKFYKPDGEVLKTDEPAIKDAVAKIRKEIYEQMYEHSKFDSSGALKDKPKLPAADKLAIVDFLRRYTSIFRDKPLSGKKVVVYQHSSLGADMLVELLRELGAETIPVDKSDKFIPIDTENVTPANQAYFKDLAQKYPDNFAIVSADGDADRPFIVDETGTFHRGDILGAVTAAFLHAKTAVVPISASDAIDIYLAAKNIKLVHTKIGSPYVIAAMEKAKTPVVGWEVNGGFLTGSDLKIGGRTLSALPTRDAFLPIVCILALAASSGTRVSDLFAALPQRFSQAGLLDNFPIETSRVILSQYSSDTPKNRQRLEAFFSNKYGFDEITGLNSLDGIRIFFKNGDIAHIRPSGNAPQMRIYSVAASQKRADEIVKLAVSKDGILQKLAGS